MVVVVAVAAMVEVDSAADVEADVEVSHSIHPFLNPPFHQLMGLTKDVDRRFQLFQCCASWRQPALVGAESFFERP